MEAAKALFVLIDNLLACRTTQCVTRVDTDTPPSKRNQLEEDRRDKELSAMKQLQFGSNFSVLLGLL